MLKLDVNSKGQLVVNYHITGKLGGRKVWQIHSFQAVGKKFE